MPEYLSPGVYVEETSYRAKSIQGVATSTAGFVGQCRSGPIVGEPVLVTSFQDFTRRFGGAEPLVLSTGVTVNYVAHAVQLFFDNGGQRVYISRVFRPNAGQTVADHTARGLELVGGAGRYRARFPGLAGNLRVQTFGLRSGNLLAGAPGSRRLSGLRQGDVVEAHSGTAALSREVAVLGPGDALLAGDLAFVNLDNQGNPQLLRADGSQVDIQDGTAVNTVQKVTLSVLVSSPDGREDSYAGLSTHAESENYIGNVLRHEDPAGGIEPPVDRSARIFLEVDSPPGDPDAMRTFAGNLLSNLMTSVNNDQQMTSGSDGQVMSPTEVSGTGAGDSATGLASLAEVEDIAIVAAPGGATLGSSDDRQAVRNRLITHCENLRYRFAILSADRNLDQAGIREARSKHDSKYAALYYPWLVIRNPGNAIGQGRDTLQIPPDGAMAGIYARSDIERGVHKAPANEVVRNVLRFSQPINKGIQDTLNPDGINCLRFFEGRGNRVWGARTISSDPEWTYLNVRRLFIFLEHSIDRGTQWAVFEPNNEELWLKIRMTIESFLYDVWRTGALLGTTPEEAFFVRCDRTTMSQGDLDNGRLVCLIGVAPTKPAEFVIFRIGQWTAEASII